MEHCTECQAPLTEKDQRKFCSRSCSVSFNNRKSPKRKRAEGSKSACIQCGESLQGKAGKKYCSHDCKTLHHTTQRFVAGTAGPRSIRTYLLKTRQHQCAVCQLTTWNAQPIALEVDHIDGDAQNNTENNLRLICPNCHAQTPTWKGRNYGNGTRQKRRKRYQDGKSW